MSKVVLVANWKNYPSSIEEVRVLMSDLVRKRDLYKKVSLFIASPYTYLDLVSTKARGLAQLASQDISNLSKGSHTGEITPEILKAFGVKLAIIGHSERRSLGETSEVIKEKIKIALKSGITPLICFGERERDTDGEHFEILREELKTLLSQLSKNEVKKVALAYEPLWAIGKSAKDSIDEVELTQTVVFVRKALSDLFGRSVAESVPILYGGSVEPDNVYKLVKNSGIKGFLVGHASLKAKSFEEITRAILER